MAFEVLISEAAEADIIEAFGFYKRENNAVTAGFKRAITDAVKHIRKYPLAFQIRYEDVRILFVEKFPFGIHFIIRKNEILILAVFHTSMNPDNWKRGG